MLADKRLLFIEDNTSYGETLMYLFELYAPRAFVHWVFSLASALLEIERSRFDVVILDLFLPDAQDLYALHVLVERLPHTTIIILTGHSQYRIEGPAAGAKAFLLKTELIGEDLIREIDRIARENA